MKTKPTLRFRLLLAASSLLAVSSASAADLTWDHNADSTASDGAGTWLNANQWLDAGLPAAWNNATPDNAIIGSGGTGGTITLGAVSAGTVSLNNFSGTYTLNGTSLDQTGGITVGTTAGNVTIGALVSGAGGMTMAGTGTLTLSDVSRSFTGSLNIENGRVFTNAALANQGVNSALGAGTTIVLGGTGTTGRLSIRRDGGFSSNRNITLATGGTGEIQFGNIGDTNFSITNADRNLTLSGQISGSGNFVKLGGAAVVLSGNNIYTGSTTVNEGQLRLNNANALSGGIGATGGTTALTINGNGTINVGATIGLTSASGNFLRGLGTGADQFQIPGGVSGFDANGSARQVIVNNDATFELQWGTSTFNPSEFLLGSHSTVATHAITVQNKIDLNGTTRTIRNNSTNGVATLSGEIRSSTGTAGLTKVGNGTLVLSGANTYNGATTISQGTLTISNASTFSNTSAINLAFGARLEVSTANANLAPLAAGTGVPFGSFLRYSSAQTAAGSGNGPGTIFGTVEINLNNVNPDYTLDFGSGSTLQNLVTATYTSPVTLSGNASINSSAQVFTLNSGGITASTAGAKTLNLTGSNTGANTVGGVIGNGSGSIAVTKTGNGSWTLAGTNTYSGATTVGAGTLTLSGTNGSIGNSAVTVAGGTFTIANTGAANNGDRLSNSAAFTMNGGTFNFNNTAGAFDYSESAGTLTLVGGASTVVIQQAAVGQTSALTFAGLSRTVGAINFSGAGLGAAADPRSTITFTSAPTLTNGIIGTWATVNGLGYATLDGSNNVVLYGTYADVNRGTGGTKAIADGSTTDVRIIQSGAAANITLGSTTTTVRSILNSVSGGTAATSTIDIASGETLRVDSINSVPAVTALTLGTATNTGTLTSATAGGDLLLINSSTALANRMTVNSVIADNTSASSLTKDGAGVLRLTGTNTYSGGTVINAGTLWVDGGNANLGAVGAGITFNGSGALSFGKNISSSPPALTYDLGTRPIALDNGAAAGFLFNQANVTITASGAITGDGGLTWARDSVVAYDGGSGKEVLNLLSTGNTFTGPITIGNGSENIGVASDFTFNSLGDSANPITFNFGSLSFSLNASGPIADVSLASRPFDLLNSNTTFRNQNATYTMTLGSVSTSTSGSKTLKLNNAGAGGTIAGGITDGNGIIDVNKAGNGIWSFAGTNTYSGVTTLSNDGGQLTILGKPALSPYTKIAGGRSTTLSLRMDDSGTVSLGNTVQPFGVDTNNGFNNYLTVDVRNNGGATTGSTLVLGKVDFASNPGDTRPGRGIRTTGANDYRLQFGDVDLSTAIQGTAAGGPHRFEPSSAPLTITGTIRQVNGNTGSSSTDNNLYFGGSAAGNLVSGIIGDALDFPSNPNATALNVTKGEASTWVFSGDNTYTGTTTVSGGMLLITGDSSGATGAVAVNGGTLGGTGTIGGNVTVAVAGNLAPGASAGILTINGNLTISAMAGGAGLLNYELATLAASDKIVLPTGTLDIGSGALGLSDFNLTDLGGLQNGTYTLIQTGQTITGSLAGDTNGTLGLATIDLQISGDGTDLELVVSGLGAGTPFDTWAATGTLPGTVTFDGDLNGDGVQDGLAFLLGAVDPDVSALDKLPTATETAGGLVLSFDMLDAASRGGTQLHVEHSNDVGLNDDWVSVLVPDETPDPQASDVTFTVSGSGTLDVTATIQSTEAGGTGKLFGRLKAVNP